MGKKHLDLSLKNVQQGGERATHLSPPWNDYIITVEGKVFNKHGRELKPQMHNGSVVVHTHINGKHCVLNVAQAVYKAFGEYKFRRTISHKDSNPYNNAIENLYTIPFQITDKAKAEYIAYAIPSVKKFIRDNAINSIQGFDSDDFLGESLLVLWKNLSLYNERTKFVSWAWKYIRFTFLTKYKKFQQIIKHECQGE